MIGKRRRDGTLVFEDFEDFRPNVTPREMFQAGVFGGTYFRPIYSRVTKQHYRGVWREFPKEWFVGLDISKSVGSSVCDPEVNKYKVVSGSSLNYWEDRGWIKAQDPYGWFQWYCRFYLGRRSPDDVRQIKRWVGIASKQKGRWRRHPPSKVVKQLLLQWGFKK